MERLLDHQLNRRQVRQYLSRSFKPSANVLHQIKNAIRISYSLAKYKGEKLIYKHLSKAITLN